MDAKIETHGRASLQPVVERARSLEAIVAEAREELRGALAAQLEEIAEAQLEAFPENIFWDYDALAAALVDAGEASAMARLGQKLCAVFRLYGGGTGIAFRYVHDFVYGFDWSRWVRRAQPEAREARAAQGPFSEPFIDYTLERGDELLELIAEDDERYPQLEAGTPRNPYSFSREPEEEAELFRALAVRSMIPVEAWRPRPKGRWDQDYRALRAELSKELGLTQYDDRPTMHG